MATVGKLVVALTAHTGPFKKQMRSANKVVDKFARQAARAAKWVAVLSAGAMVASIKIAADFEKQMANVGTMLDEVGMQRMPEFSQGVRRLAKEMGESTETLSKGLYDILSASVAPAEAMQVLEASSRAATAGLTDTGVSADAIMTILNSYQIAASDAADVSDLLFAIVKRGKTTFGELAPAIGQVASTGAIAGLSLEEMGASLATMTRAGLRTDEAVTSLNNLLRAFIKPTSDATKAAAELGITLNTETLRTEGLAGVMKKLSGASAEQLGRILPNIRGMKGMAAALQDVEGFTSDLELMTNRAGGTQEAFAKQTDTATFAIGQMNESIKDLGRVIGTEFLPVVQNMARTVTTHINAITKRFNQIKTMVILAGVEVVLFIERMNMHFDLGCLLVAQAFELLWHGIKLGFAALWDEVSWAMTDFLNSIIPTINKIINALNQIPKVDISPIDFVVKGDMFQKVKDQISDLDDEYNRRRWQRIRQYEKLVGRVSKWAMDQLAGPGKAAEDVANKVAKATKKELGGLQVLVKAQFAGAVEKGTVAGYSASLPNTMKAMQRDMADTADNTDEANDHLASIEGLLEDQMDMVPEAVGF